MKRRNICMNLALHNIHFLIFFFVLSIGLSEIVVKGSGLIAEAIDKLLRGEWVEIRQLAETIGVFIAVSMALSFVKKVCGEMYSIRIQKKCRDMTADSLCLAQYEYVSQNSGALITKLIQDISNIGELFSEIVPDILHYTVTIVTLCISIFFINQHLLAAILLCFPVVLFISDRISKKINMLAKQRRGKYDELTAAAADALAGIEIVKSYDLHEILMKRINHIADNILVNEYARNRYQAISFALENLIQWVPTICCCTIALIEVFHAEMSVGELVGFIVLFIKISSPMGELPFRINDGREMLVSAARLNDVINAPKEQSGDYDRQVPFTDKNIISLENISFWYDEHPERKILDGLELHIEKGKTTAIVGASGAGKTTLLKLLCGFEKQKSGTYRLMGVDFARWKIEAARKNMAVVFQNVFLFPDTIKENILFGKRNADAQEMDAICRAACVDEFVKTFPLAYETKVGERGTNVSGGERQRISIARALLKDADILLLDEPTSALDMKTEEVISKAMKSDGQHTVIVIAHRLSTIKDADHIVVLHQGKAAESGSHEELMKQQGIYAGLYSRERSAALYEK